MTVKIDDKAIELVARAMCKNMGIDPDRSVHVPDYMVETDYEVRWSRFTENDVPFIMGNKVEFPLPTPAVYTEFWQVMRQSAARAIAAHFAVREMFLTHPGYSEATDGALNQPR